MDVLPPELKLHILRETAKTSISFVALGCTNREFNSLLTVEREKLLKLFIVGTLPDSVHLLYCRIASIMPRAGWYHDREDASGVAERIAIRSRVVEMAKEKEEDMVKMDVKEMERVSSTYLKMKRLAKNRELFLRFPEEMPEDRRTVSLCELFILPSTLPFRTFFPELLHSENRIKADDYFYLFLAHLLARSGNNNRRIQVVRERLRSGPHALGCEFLELLSHCMERISFHTLDEILCADASSRLEFIIRLFRTDFNNPRDAKMSLSWRNGSLVRIMTKIGLTLKENHNRLDSIATVRAVKSTIKEKRRICSSSDGDSCS